MTTKQWWWFILFTLPFCAMCLAGGLSSMSFIPSKLDLNLRIGNVWSSSGTTYPAFSKQEILQINK